MKLIRRAPVYATGLGLALAVVSVADARDWGWILTASVGLGVALFYVVAILVPYLIREELGQTLLGAPRRATADTFVSRLPESDLEIVPATAGNGHPVVTHVSATMRGDLTTLELESPEELGAATNGPPLVGVAAGLGVATG